MANQPNSLAVFAKKRNLIERGHNDPLVGAKSDASAGRELQNRTFEGTAVSRVDWKFDADIVKFYRSGRSRKRSHQHCFPA
jgi:hypothetical protein